MNTTSCALRATCLALIAFLSVEGLAVDPPNGLAATSSLSHVPAGSTFECLRLPARSRLGDARRFACSTSVADQSVRLRILTYNIHHGVGVDEKLDLDRIAKVIRSAEPDIVALQEVDSNTARTDRVDQPNRLAKLTGMQVVFGDNIPFQGGRYGNAVLTRLPVLRHTNHRLPSFYDGEQRGVLEVEVQPPGLAEPLLFLATHLDYRRGSKERLASAQQLNAWAAERIDAPAILAGDLNAEPGSPTLRTLAEHWQATAPDDLFTFPVEQPSKQIDYILVRPATRWRLIEATVLDESTASDHRPVLVVAELSAN